MPEDKKIKRFVVKVGDTYYMTKGKMLTYNMEEAKKSGDQKKIDGVKEMEKDYQEEHDKPHTFYHAVDFSDVQFKGINTGEVP